MKNIKKSTAFAIVLVVLIVATYVVNRASQKTHELDASVEKAVQQEAELQAKAKDAIANLNEASITTENQIFKIGDQAKIGTSIITINKVEYSQGGQYMKPTKGNEWINLNVTIENTNSSQQYVTTLGQMFIRDRDKNSYQVSATNKTLENPGLGLDGQIIAQSKRTGWVGFEILKTAKGLQFQYNDSTFGDKTILFDLDR